MDSYRVELIWNREFHWCSHGDSYSDLERAKKRAQEVVNAHGDGGAKKVRVVNESTEKVEWIWG